MRGNGWMVNMMAMGKCFSAVFHLQECRVLYRTPDFDGFF